ncbi:hypothetical protein AHF37_04181 [Paragonimus kellicotti]|nr:hypothetical protein AHF37_04181 [Paragonimus kellicotti]
MPFVNSIVFGMISSPLTLFIHATSHCKRHLLHTFASPVTGLGIHLFCSNYPGVQQAIQSESSAARGDPQGPVVFATTDQCIMSFVLSRRDEVLCKTVLDRFGASANCSSMFPVASDVAQFAVACRDVSSDQLNLKIMINAMAVYVYSFYELRSFNSCSCHNPQQFKLECLVARLKTINLRMHVERPEIVIRVVTTKRLIPHKAVYFYNWDGRGPCLATDGNKLALSVFKQYLVILKGDPCISRVLEVSCLCVDETLQLIVFGHTNGQLQLLRGDITRERHCKRHLLHTFASPVTGLGIHLFCSNYPGVQQAIQSESSAARGDPQGPVVFATTDQCIMSFVLSRRDEVLCKTVLDRFGASANCSSMFPVASDVAQFAVACRDAVYFYNWDGRGPCLATDGNKLALSVFKQYLVILKGDPGLFLSQVGNMPRSHSSTNVPTHTARSANPTTVVIHDQQNKFITGEFTVYGVRSMFTEWDGIYLLCLDTSSDGSVKYTSSMLEVSDAYSLHFCVYPFVTHLCCSTFYHRTKKSTDTAIQQYVKTIGILEASFVIQRFLEGGHIVQLAYYLEALDSAGLASSDHLVLLLNCYARLQDKERIAQFVQGPVRPQLNVSTAIQVLRQASYPQAALKLAEACSRFVDQVGILIEDLDDCAGALAIIERFPFDEALKAVCAHGHWLMDRLPTETVQLLDQLCSRPGTSEINVHHFLKIFINNRDGLMQFLERYVKTTGKLIKVAGVVDALLELALYEANRLENDSDGTAKSTVRSSSREHLLKLALSLLRDDQVRIAFRISSLVVFFFMR